MFHAIVDPARSCPCHSCFISFLYLSLSPWVASAFWATSLPTFHNSLLRGVPTSTMSSFPFTEALPRGLESLADTPAGASTPGTVAKREATNSAHLTSLEDVNPPFKPGSG